MALNPWTGVYADPDISKGLGRDLTVSNPDSQLAQNQKSYLWNLQQGKIPTQWANTIADAYKMRDDNSAKGLNAQIYSPSATMGTMSNYSTMDQWNNQGVGQPPPVAPAVPQVVSPSNYRWQGTPLVKPEAGWGTGGVRSAATPNVCPTCGKPW